MSDDEAQEWRSSPYPHEAQDVLDAHAAMVRYIDAKLKTLNPATMTAEEAARVQRWTERSPIEPDFRRGIGFPIAPEKFCTVDDFGLLNKHLSVVLENEGYMRHSARCLKKGKNPLLTSHVAISTKIVLSTR